MRQLDGKPNNASPSIDRFSPTDGYVLGNVHVICWRCNNLKRDVTSDELLMVASWMKKVEEKD